MTSTSAPHQPVGATAAAFDVCGPLPTGVTVLEASAGTGKTFTIAALAARYVAAGTPLTQLLLVTFTRMATGELRERVRERLVSAERGLTRALAGVAPPAADDVLRLLARGSPEDVERRRRRLATALADFDGATIATTHRFCQDILGGLGIAGDVERDVVFLHDPRDLVAEVVDDFYVRYGLATGGVPPFDRAEAQRIARVAVDNPTTRLEPAAAAEHTPAALRWRFAVNVREEVDRRKRRATVLTYDDLLTRLADTLGDPVRGAAAGQRLRQRYRVVLVDEFQDTDPVQWRILRRAFGHGEATLVLIGDPKQAIYAFRGADVFAYLEAARSAATRATLDVNWRSDQGLLDAYDTLFAGATLGHDGITYRTVRAADAHQRSGLADVPDPAPLRLRLVNRDDGHVRQTQRDYVQKHAGLRHIAADLAADVVALLSSDGWLLARHPDGAPAGRERVAPRHLAVLVPKHQHATLVRDALAAAGVPAVVNGAGSVLATPVAREWLALLEALERPASPARARAAALTSFLGWDARQVAVADDHAWEDIHARLHHWAAVLRGGDVAALLELITVSEGLPARVLARHDGERRLTDLRHVGQLLHAEATSEHLGVTALTAWLRQRITDAADDSGIEERSRRLDSDADAVQVLTIHRSKGLEFPIVYYPYLWDWGGLPRDAIPIFHDPDADHARTINVGMDGPGFADHRRRSLTERRGEDLRLAYVALTRARHQAVVWWAASWQAANSPLGRLLFAHQPDGSIAADVRDGPPEDVEAIQRCEDLADAAPGCISVATTSAHTDAVWSTPRAATPALQIRRFDRDLDATWRRNSYSRLTAGAHEARVGSEPDDGEQPGVSDETGMSPAPVATAADEGVDETHLRAVACPLATTPGGAAIGSLVHAVLEHVDFAAADLDAQLATQLEQQRAWRHLDVGDPVTLVAGLRAAIDTPLGPLVGERALRDVGTDDRRDELDFELPLVGGDAPSGHLTLDVVADLLRDHLPADDVLAGYADRLADSELPRDLRGYLTGSIDLVLRTREDAGSPRFTVVDYKTNWLGVDGEALSAWHYRPAALTAAMMRAHYPLQALLYSVALHRYLRWRLAAYDPERHLAGVAYLFVRGMTGTQPPRVHDQPCGVFAWQPPTALITALSEVFDRGRPPA